MTRLDVDGDNINRFEISDRRADKDEQLIGTDFDVTVVVSAPFNLEAACIKLFKKETFP